MNRLLEIGFEPAGHWLLAGGGTRLHVVASRLPAKHPVRLRQRRRGPVRREDHPSLYARMAGYKNPSPNQTTNVRNNARIKALLQAGAAVDILALPDNGLLHYGQFHLNLAAGLEDSLIAVIAPPVEPRGAGPRGSTRPGR